MDPTILNAIKKVLKRETGSHPAEGLVHAIDGTRIDVYISASALILRNVPVAGDVASLVIGQIVSLRWEGERPTAIAIPGSNSLPIAVNVMVDDDSIENSPFGLSVKKAGIRPWHLSFEPSMAGHTHNDSLQKSGWNTDADGAIYKNATYIHPNGQISLGASPNVIKFDAAHATYRMWVGNVDPASAGFAVEKDGNVHIRSGSMIVGTGDNVGVISTPDGNGWTIWAGDSDPAAAPFRVKNTGEVWLDNAHVSVNLESTNYVADLSGWKIDNTGWAEFNNIKLRGKITSTVFEKETISGISGRMVVTSAASVVTDVGNSDTTITFDSQAFSAGDIIHFKSTTRQEWLHVTDNGTLNGLNYDYTVERDINGDGAELWYVGEIAFREGNAELSELPGMPGEPMAMFGGIMPGGNVPVFSGGHLELEGGTTYGPYFGVRRRVGTEYDQLVHVVRLGNLKNFLDVENEVYGIGIGDEFRYLRYTTESGLTLRTASGGTVVNDEGILTNALMIVPSDVPSFVDGRAFLYVNNDEIVVHYKNGTTETDTVLNKLNGLPPVLQTEETADRVVTVLLNGPSALSVSDMASIPIPACMDGFNLVNVKANCGKDRTSGASSSGNVVITIQNGTTSMLTSNLRIDQGQYDNLTSSVPVDIDLAADHVAENNIVNVEVYSAGTGVTYVIVTLVFRKPAV